MKKITSLLILISLFANQAVADCDFSKGITEGPNKTFIYTEECHLQVGRLIQQNNTLTAQLGDLNKAIELKDLALAKSDARTQLWIDTNDKLGDRLTKIDETYKHNEWLYFGLGVLTTFAAGYGIARIVR